MLNGKSFKRSAGPKIRPIDGLALLLQLLSTKKVCFVGSMLAYGSAPGAW